MQKIIHNLMYSLVIIGLFSLVTFSCKKDKEETIALPSVSSTSVTSVYIYTAIGNGNVTADNGYPVTERGFCWNTSADPNLSNSKIISGAGTGTFSQKITGLTLNTKYYIRAYATSSQGTSYGNELSFTTLSNTMTDGGDSYKIVQIGSQVWMAQNLRRTTSPNGTPIDQIQLDADWGALANDAKAYCWYNNEVNNAAIYGALYTYAATIYTSGIIKFPTSALKGGIINPIFTFTQGICPSGWHLPTAAEWDTLTINLGVDAAKKLKETGTNHWLPTNTGATNETGFTAVAGGYRSYAGTFYALTSQGFWWTSSAYNADNYKYMSMSYDNNVAQYFAVKKYGFSVRCVKD